MAGSLVFPHWCVQCYRDVYDQTTYKLQSQEIVCKCGNRILSLSEEDAHKVNEEVKARFRPVIWAAHHNAHGGRIYSDELARRLQLDHGLVKSIINELAKEGKLEWL